MAISNEIRYTELDDLYLDPLNPRLGRHNTGKNVTQQTILKLMRDWTLDELAVSYLESGGFWAHEALLIAEESLYGKKRKVVIEGNRRLAALMYLRDAINKAPANRTWKDIAQGAKPNAKLFTKIPYIKVGSRKELESFLGFRHVTGIKQWNPAEKAEYIAKLIDERKLSYVQVMRKIGSKTPSVRQNYISYRMLLQVQDLDTIPLDLVEERFSVMYLSLRTKGVQKYLNVDILADPRTAKKPIPRSRLAALENFAGWLFGTDEKLPLISDSRQIDDFGRALLSKKATDYLERNESPRLDVAVRMAGGDEPQVVQLIEEGSDKIELSLSRVYAHKKSAKVERAVVRFAEAAFGLFEHFPDIRDEFIYEEDE